MLTLRTLTLTQLGDEAPKWDELWTQSVSELPSKRAAGVQLFCDVFAKDAEFVALVVEQEDRFVAALPLLKEHDPRWITKYSLTSNCMVMAGDLLIDPNCDTQSVTELIAQQVAGLDGSLAAFEGIDILSERWTRFRSVLNGLGRQTHVSDGFDVGEIDILHDWDAYVKSWSRNHRSAIKRCRKKLNAEGTVAVIQLRNPSDDELYETLEDCFVVEDLGWKGDEGTSILKTPALRSYLHQEARLIRDLGMLDLWLLKLDGKIIAFEYCQLSRGTCFSYKISFDPAFERFSPGRVLRCIQLERYHQDESVKCLNTLGMLCSAKAKWTTKSYRSSRLFVATGGPLSNLAMAGFKLARSAVKRLRKDSQGPETLSPGAASYLETADPQKPSLQKASTAQPAVLPVGLPRIDASNQQSSNL